MTHQQACRPCARRKVRCDRLEPCANCKRRTTDRCTYPASTPSDRIRQLENLVQELSHNTVDSRRSPKVAQSALEHNGEVSPAEMRSNDPVITKENGVLQYLESYVAALTHMTHFDSQSRAWQRLPAKVNSDGQSHPSLGRYFQPRPHPHAMASSVATGTRSEVPSPRKVSILWNVFFQRVEPLVRIMFRWATVELRIKTTSLEQPPLDATEYALVTAIYYASVRSLTDDDCRNLLQESRATLLADYQSRCEEALQSTNLFCMSDITTIKAIIFYFIASFDRLSTPSLWSLMGMTIRNAEKLGLHRDGSILNLPPVEIEDRRRVWWQLQHMDLFLAVRIGMTPMTLAAGWDVQLPSNIEDEDITPASATMPTERKGLTSMSYCLFTYWVLQRQRQTFIPKHGRFELSWQTNTALPTTTKIDMLSQLEEGINKNFLQYCDPIKPLDVLLQLFARLFNASMQLRVLHARACAQGGLEERRALLVVSTQILRYIIAIQTQPALADFRWLTKAWFIWQAFMSVLVESHEESDPYKEQELWVLLSDVYAAQTDLLALEDDRRNLHAAELVFTAWNAHCSKNPGKLLEAPAFVVTLSNKLAEYRARFEPNNVEEHHNTADLHQIDPASIEGVFAEGNYEFDMDLQDIDWNFWNSID